MVHTLFGQAHLLCISDVAGLVLGVEGLSDFSYQARKWQKESSPPGFMAQSSNCSPSYLLELGLVISSKSAKASVYWINSSFNPWSSAHSAAPTWELTFHSQRILHLWNTHFVFSLLHCFSFSIATCTLLFSSCLPLFALLHLSSNSVK